MFELGGLRFDYSEKSVNDLEDLISNRLWDPAVPPTEEELDSNTKLIGAYLGEVMIRHIGGHWAMDPEGRIPVVESDSGHMAYVLDKVYRRQVFGKEHDLMAFYEGWGTRLPR
jgi:hypothetical protein